MRDGEDLDDVLVIDSMAGIDAEAVLGGEAGCADEALELALLLLAGGVCKCAGVELDGFGAEGAGGLDLLGVGLDEEADADAGALEAADGGLELAEVARGIEAALGGDLAAILWDEADILGQDAEGDGEDLGGVAHFEIQPGNDALAEAEDVAILDVAAICAEVDGDGAGAGALACAGGEEDIGLDHRRLRHGGVARLAEGGDVVDIDAELKAFHGRKETVTGSRGCRKKGSGESESVGASTRWCAGGRARVAVGLMAEVPHAGEDHGDAAV